MGCCSTTNKVPQETMLIEKLKYAIDANSPERIRVVLNMLEAGKKTCRVDEPIVELKEIVLNPLAYSVWLGNIKAFRCLHEEFNAKVSVMEEQLAAKNISALDIICQRGFTDMLLHYIPLYLTLTPSVVREDQNGTVEFDKTLDVIPRNSYTPVQKACEMSHIMILLNVFNYFKGKTFTPYTLDIEYQEEHSGENCVLIACRTGNYSMLKFLFETVKANFAVTNKHGENAINVCLAGNKKRPSKIYLECLMYLIETAKVDVRYQYEESLLMAQDKEMVLYLEAKLNALGINASKYAIEKKNLISPAPIPKTELDMELDAAEEFHLRDYIDEECDRSGISSIGNFESHIGTPFMSVMGGNNSILAFH